MIDYELFKDVVTEKLLDYMSPLYKEAHIHRYPISRINSEMTYDGLAVVRQDADVCPVVDLKEQYEKYQETGNLDFTMSRIADFVSMQYDMLPEISIETVDDIKNNVVFELVNAKENQKQLNDSPNRAFKDLTVAYRVVLGADEHYVNSVHITNKEAESFGLTEEELYNAACENMKRVYPTKVTGLLDYVKENMRQAGFSREEITEMIGNSAYGNRQWIISNESDNGATALLDIEAFKNISDETGGNIIIIPSSTHEVLAVDATLIGDNGELAALIEDMNMTAVDPDERLSNQMYMYDRGINQIKTITPEIKSKIITFEREPLKVSL